MISTVARTPTRRGPRRAERRPREAEPRRQGADERLLMAAAVGGVGILVAAGLSRSRGPLIQPLDRKARRLMRGPWWHRVPKTAWWSGGHHTRRHALAE